MRRFRSPAQLSVCAFSRNSEKRQPTAEGGRFNYKAHKDHSATLLACKVGVSRANGATSTRAGVMLGLALHCSLGNCTFIILLDRDGVGPS
jgi:hypothetical protein